MKGGKRMGQVIIWAVSNCVNIYPFHVCVIMIRLGERMTIKLRKNSMFRGLQRWDGCGRFT